ncbi:hypothetical protein Tco_0271986 [Tanacetum coccineum]
MISGSSPLRSEHLRSVWRSKLIVITRLETLSRVLVLSCLKRSAMTFASLEPQAVRNHFFSRIHYSALTFLHSMPVSDESSLPSRQSSECLLLEPSIGDNLILSQSSSRHSTLGADQIGHQFLGADNGSYR